MPAKADRSSIGSWLMLAILLFFFVTTTPFADTSNVSLTAPQGANSNLFNQLMILLISAGIIAYGAKHHLIAATILQPRALLIPLFIWFALASALSDDPIVAMRKIVLAVLICVDASIVLLLPRSERHFAKLLLIATLIMLAVAYFGVIALPARAINQFTDAFEPEHAGLWHGQFPHKNAAAAVMVLASFIGLFAIASGYRLGGLVVIGLSIVFLAHTGGKSAIGYLPAVLVVAWLFERVPWLRIPVAVAGPLGFNALAIGCALSDEVRTFVQSIGIDPTFTNRTDIWRVALDAIGRRPITGYGFQGFWQTDALFYGGSTPETWAVQAFNGHNSWIDLVLTTGFPSAVMVFLWLMVMPLRDIARAEARGGMGPLMRLFTRVWLYGLVSSCLETGFFENGDPLWFALLFSIAGMRLQGIARLRTDAPAASTPDAAPPPWSGPAVPVGVLVREGGMR